MYDCTWDGSVAVVLRKPRDAAKKPSLNTPKSHRSFPECCCRGYCQFARWPMNFPNHCADPKHLRKGKASMFFLGHFQSLVNGEWIERTRWAKRRRPTRGQHPKRHAWSIFCGCPPTFIEIKCWNNFFINLAQQLFFEFVANETQQKKGVCVKK